MHPTADRPLVVAVGNDRQFASLCRVWGCRTCRPIPASSPARTGSPQVDTLAEIVSTVTVRRTADEWFDVLTCRVVFDDPEGVPVSDADSTGSLLSGDGAHSRRWRPYR